MIRLVWTVGDYGDERALYPYARRVARKGRRRFYREREGGTEWGPIDSQPERMEPKQDWYSTEWGVRLFGWQIALVHTVWE